MFLLLQTRKTLQRPNVYFPLQSHFSTCTSANPPLLPQNGAKPINADSVTSFLKCSGFSQTQLDRIKQIYPQILSSNLDKTLKPKLDYFRDFGFSDSETAQILSSDPCILGKSLSNRIAPNLASLTTLLGSKPEVLKLLIASGAYAAGFFKHDLNNRLVPNVDYLTSCGVGMDQIRSHLPGAVRLMLRKPDEVRELVDRAEGLGADRSSRVFFLAVKAVSQTSEENLGRKLRSLRELGFSEGDILNLFRNGPVVLCVSLEKVNGIKEVLLATGKYTMESIIRCPAALTYSVEKRYKPRLCVLGVLERKKMIKEWPGLGCLCVMPDEKFFKRFVAPYLKGSSIATWGSFYEVAEVLERTLK